MKIAGIIILILLTAAVGFQIRVTLKSQEKLNAELRAVQEEVGKSLGETAKIRDELEFFSHPDNREKELRARFNYRKPDEKLIIVVPDGAAGGE